MAAVDILLQLASKFGEILIAPIRNPDMLWIILPIYLNWIFTDYFQERKGTSFGNAITNGVVMLWVGLDWARQTLRAEATGLDLATKAGIGIFFIIYGLIIMIESARAKKIAHYIGRVREISYFMIVLTPIVYGTIAFDTITLGAILLFFPIWYAIGEAIDRALPAPLTEEDELGAAPAELKMPEMPSAGLPPMGGGLPPLQ